MTDSRPRIETTALAAVAVLLLGIYGCYHATIETGLAPSGETKKIWAHSWVYGLVPPSVVKAQSECGDGVARVETQLTFVNQLVGGLTFGIYTPMEIAVTCAARRTGSAEADSTNTVEVARDADYATVMDAFAKASDTAVSTGAPAYVIFRSEDSK